MNEQEPNTTAPVDSIESSAWDQEKKDEFATSYVSEYPEAITDTSKAELMASASSNQELAVVEARKTALEAASHIGDDNISWRDDDNYSAKNSMELKTQKALDARSEADALATAAAETYDIVTKL